MKLKLFFLLSAVALVFIALNLNSVDGVSSYRPCDSAPLQGTTACDASASVADRVAFIISKLSVDEKIALLGTNSKGSASAGIPDYQWWSEALHGVADSPGVKFGGPLPFATSFPQIIGMAASFNESLWSTMGGIISTEARAFSNSGQAGLTYFTPNINIFRDPRWGRGQETPGEDPFLASQYAQVYVYSLQEVANSRNQIGEYTKVVATCKHYAAYDLENWGGVDRNHFNAVVRDQDLLETYLPPFESCVRQGNARSVMCSYNEVNGIPSCANTRLLQSVMRDLWGFSGYVVSDCGAIDDILYTHKYAASPEAAVADALHGGCDLDCGSFYQKNAKSALTGGFITEADIDKSVGRLFTEQMRLGMFDPLDSQPFTRFTPDAVNTAFAQQAALDAARQSIILLENDNNTLPLDRSVYRTVAVVGPHGNSTTDLLGNYYGYPPYIVSPLAGLQNRGLKTLYAQGCDVPCMHKDGFNDAIAAAAAADVTLLFLGLNQDQESEGKDRTLISLPGFQWDLLDAVNDAAGGKPVILVFIGGGPTDLTYAKVVLDGIVWAGYPGQSGGDAIADVLFGDYNPAGRLPYTIYPSDYTDQISFFNMAMRTPPGRTYKFFVGEAVYPFGWGLSYTTFAYSWTDPSAPLSLTLATDRFTDIKSTEAVVATLNITVTNIGKRDGDDSVLAFLSYHSVDPTAPLRELFGFQRVFAAANGGKATVQIPVTARQLLRVNSEGRYFLKASPCVLTVENLHFTVNWTGAGKTFSYLPAAPAHTQTQHLKVAQH